MLRKSLIKRKTGAREVRWRLHSPARIEALTDSVFAFAVTLIVVSLEVPKTFKDLLYSMRGFFGFSICFAMLMLIWYEQYLFFRRFGLQDLRTIVLNAFLLFIVLFYVYPLKFLFGFLTQGNESLDAAGKVIYKFTENYQISQLMIIYGIGFMAIYIIFLLMHHNAYRKREFIGLNRLEIFNTRTIIYSKLVRIGIGLLSVLMALFGVYFRPEFGLYAGLAYALIGPALGLLHSKRRKVKARLFTKEEIDQVDDEIIILEPQKVKS